MELCKVRFDGCHHMVAPYKNTSSFKTKDLIMKSHDELGLEAEVEKKDFFVNEWAKEHFPFSGKGRKKIDERYKKLHEELKKLFIILYGSEKKLKDDEMIKTLYDLITSDYDMVNYYNLDLNEENIFWLDVYIRKFVRNEKENLKGRKGLFRRKALNNDWNYFVTFTYDDKKHDEESFVKSLKKKLQNLHTNHGWLYMGCFERSKTERLHFHGLISVPQGKMRGNIREETYYDTTAHKRAVSFINEDFEEKIGRNDFKAITKNDLTFTHALDYILKYIGKSDNKIVYSRGIKDDYFALMDVDEENMLCRVHESSPYFVLGDTSMIELNKRLEVVEVRS